MKWVKSKLFENIGKKIFLDDYGFCTVNLHYVTIDDKSLDQVYVYSEQHKRYERMVVDANSLDEAIKLILGSNLATRKLQKNNIYFGYNHSQPFTSAEADEYKMKCVKILLTIWYSTTLTSGRTQNVDEKIEISSENDLKKYICWRLDNNGNDNDNDIPFQQVDLSTLNDNDELYLVGTGKVTIKKKYDFPNKENQILSVEDTKNKTFNILLGSELFYLPYNHKKDLLDEIDDAKNELLLSPYVSFTKELPGVYNIYWKPIPEASRYIVSVFKITDKLKGPNYKLADFDVDRNTCYLALDKLVGGAFVFKVSAEDRSGNIIAKSRGAINGSPLYMK